MRKARRLHQKTLFYKPYHLTVQFKVSYNAPTKDVATSEQVEQKNRRIGTMLQNYELQRRMHADSLNVGSNQANNYSN